MYPSELFKTKNLVDKIETRRRGRGRGGSEIVRSRKQSEEVKLREQE